MSDEEWRPPAAEPSGSGTDGTPLSDFWRNGLRFESADKAFSLYVGGRAQFDVVDYIAPATLRQNIEVFMRKLINDMQTSR